MINFIDRYDSLKTYLEHQLDNFEVLLENPDNSSASFSANVFDINMYFYINKNAIIINYTANVLLTKQKLGIHKLKKKMLDFIADQNLAFCLENQRKDGVHKMCFSCGEANLQYFMSTPCFGYTNVTIASDGNVACNVMSKICAPHCSILDIFGCIWEVLDYYFSEYSENECRPSTTLLNGIVFVELIGEEKVIEKVSSKITETLDEKFLGMYENTINQQYDEPSKKVHLSMEIKA